MYWYTTTRLLSARKYLIGVSYHDWNLILYHNWSSILLSLWVLKESRCSSGGQSAGTQNPQLPCILRGAQSVVIRIRLPKCTNFFGVGEVHKVFTPVRPRCKNLLLWGDQVANLSFRSKNKIGSTTYISVVVSKSVCCNLTKLSCEAVDSANTLPMLHLFISHI